MNDVEHYYDLCSNEKERRNTAQRLDQLKSECNQMIKTSKESHDQIIVKRKIASLVLDGQKYRDAEVEATIEIENEKNHYTIEEIAQELLKYIYFFE